MQKSIYISAGILLLCIATVFACGCTSPVEQPEPPITPSPTQGPSSVYLFDQTNNNETYSVGLDSEIRLRLPGNPTTGYTWQMNATQGIVIVNESYIPDDKSGTMVGSGGTYHWIMKPIQPGNQMISGVYARPWESNVTNLQTFTLNLAVGEILTPPGVPPVFNVYTEQDSGQNVNESLGDEFNIRLAENPTTGYTWNMTPSMGLEMTRDEFISSHPSGQIAGGGGVHSFYMKAVHPGVQTLHGEYRRSWVQAGKVAFIDLEGGFYGIIGDDGTDYFPLGMDDQYKKDGLRVAFEYEPEKDVATIQMWGIPINLTFIEEITTFDLSIRVT
jgi:inhibitor of cysteine peptidase